MTRQLTALAGNLWCRTLTAGRAERNEYLLLHEFHGAKYICPDKSIPKSSSKGDALQEEQQQQSSEDEEERPKKASTTRRKPAYVGGLVLEPKRAFYDKLVLLLDFNSLYPSIIQEYNICFTTVHRVGDDRMPEVPGGSTPTGILPRILANLVARRRAIKAQMKGSVDPVAHASLNIRQQALKLTANSMYGCLGFPASRFFARPLAMLVTAKGREVLSATVELARQSCSLDVIYGDTDSIMIAAMTDDLPAALAAAQLVRTAVNERYRLLEIDVDGVFARLLLLKKKKYAALVIDNYAEIAAFHALPEHARPQQTPPARRMHIESKGLDLVRRDWCPLSVDVSTFILEQMMLGQYTSSGNGLASAIHEQLALISAGLHNVPVHRFVISKNLTKEPEAYADARSQPHVVVALRMRGKGMAVSTGSTIPYVVCRSSRPSDSLAERSFHPDDVAKDSLPIDYEWYAHTQLHPVIARLCEFVSGTDAAQLAAALGLDTRRYRPSPATPQNPLFSSSASSAPCRPLYTRMSPEERFKGIEALCLQCRHCSASFPLTSLARLASSALINGLQCPECRETLSSAALFSQALQHVEEQLRLYQCTQWRCSDPSCAAITARLSVQALSDRCTKCGGGRLMPIISADSVHNRLLYYLHVLDTEACRQSILRMATNPNATTAMSDKQGNQGDMLASLKSIHAEADPTRLLLSTLISQSAYANIDFSADIFAPSHLAAYAALGAKYGKRDAIFGILETAA